MSGNIGRLNDHLVPEHLLTEHEKNKRVKQMPGVATDMIIEYVEHGKEGLILIERKFEPYGIALAGGYLEPELWGQENAIKEAGEETKLEMIVSSVKFHGVYDDPLRDPRRRLVALVYYGQGVGQYKGDDDAKKAFFVPHEKVAEMIEDPTIWAFKDHRFMIKDYYRKKEEGRL